MKKIFLLSLWAMLHQFCLAQKKPLTDTSYTSWESIQQGMTKINDDGSYFYYQINNRPIGNYTFVLSATDKSWKREYINANNYNFTMDGRHCFLMQSDSLVHIALQSKKINIISNCKGYKLQQNKNYVWLLYQSKDRVKELNILNLHTKKLKIYVDVEDYEIDPNGAVIILKTKRNDQEKLTWLDLNNGIAKDIYFGPLANGLIFDKSGYKLAFYTVDNGLTKVWCYDNNQQAALPFADDNSVGISKDHIIATETWKFSNDGEDLFFNQKLKGSLKNKQKHDPLIWNYQDAYLVNYYNPDQHDSGRNLTKLHWKDRKVQQLLSGVQTADFNQPGTDVLIVQDFYGRQDELPWNQYAKTSYYLLNTKTNALMPIKKNSKVELKKMSLSPDNRFLVYYDTELETYISLDIHTKQSRTLERLYGGASGIDDFKRNLADDNPMGISCWIAGTTNAIIQGKQDLWKVDVTGKQKPVNLTNAADNLIYSMFTASRNEHIYPDQTLYINCFDRDTKSLELFCFKVDGYKTPLCKSLSPAERYNDMHVFIPTKTGILKLNETANYAPNYSFVNNQHRETVLTNVHPERSFEWMTSELLKYEDADGSEYEGIIYKPENFDTNKKYPVIFRYYWDNSNQFNSFITPEPKNIGLNIPLLLSQGYIVFWPNIYSEERKPGESGLKSMLAGLDHLSSYKWVDTSRMALMGHSWGGYLTNYIVSKSNRFKAAVSFAGVSNLMEMYNQYWPGFKFSYQPFLKNFFGMVEGLEFDVSNYVINSPIIYAKDMQTPLLIVHNDRDNHVPVSQSTELFIQLRSLNKPTWLLQYEGETHALLKITNQLDCQRKMMRFFDFYLKDQPLPDWMSSQISPK